MSVRNKRYSILILTLLIMGAAIILTCSDKIVNSGDTDIIEFQMPLKFSEGSESLAEVATIFKVTIIAGNDTIIANLEYSHGNITGLIENVPAGPDRIIIVEGLADDGTVIFRGNALITVVAGQTVDAEITLLAVAKLVRVSPNFVDGAYGNSFVSNVRVDNIAGLTAISLTLDYNSAVVELDRVIAGANPAAETIFSYDNDGGITIEISHSAPIVNSSGNAILASAYFTPVVSNKCLDSTNLDIGIVALTAPGVSLSTVFVDDGQAYISSGRLVVSSDTLKFGLGVPGLNLDFKKVDISDSCGNEIAYVISTEEPWIDLNTALAGITPGSIFIDVDTTGLPSGKYEGRVRISSAKATNAAYDIVVKLDLDRGVRNLQVSPQQVDFFAIENGAIPAARRIQVEEAYGYNVAFTAAEDIPWLSINKTSGTTPDSVIVSVTTTELEPRTYIETVLITSPGAVNSPTYVTVTYVVESGARILNIAPVQMYFTAEENGELPANQEIQISELNGNTILFGAGEEIPWLNINKNGGTTPDSITVSITTTALEPDTYADTIVILSSEADNSPQYVSVVYELTRAPRTLAIEPTSLHFTAIQGGAKPEPQTFRVFETGGHNISYSASDNIYWLSLSSGNGDTDDTITVSVNTTDLDPGLYRDSIQISSNEADNSPIYLIVSLGVSVGPRTIEVEPDSIYLEYIQNSDAFPTATFRVFESGGYHIPFSAIEDLSWIFLSDTSGFTEDTIVVFALPELEPALYVDSILILSTTASNPLVYVKVILNVTEEPKFLVVEPDSFHFVYEVGDMEALPYTDTFLVRELSGLDLAFNVTEDIPWLLISDLDGITPDKIRLYAGPTLVPGFYFDSVMILSDDALNSPVYVKVTYEVMEQRNYLAAEPDSLHFEFIQYSDAFPTGRFRVSEEDGHEIAFDATENSDWISLYNVSGVTPDQIDVGVDFSLEPGIYVDSIVIASDEAVNSPVYVNVVLEIVYTPPPALDVFPDTLYFTAQESGNLPDSQLFDVSYNSYPTPFIVTESIPWLFVTYDTGFVGSDVTVYISSTELEPGVYFDSILVSADQLYIPAYEYVRYTVDSIELAPTISGIVKDSYGEPLADVLIIAYENSPNGSALDSEFTDANGAFSFFDINGYVKLFAFRDGYYPQTVSVVTPDNNVLISLLATSAFTPTDKWVDLYCDSSYVQGKLILPHDVIEAFDPDGVLCGRFIVHTEGAFGFMQVYADDPYSPTIDEGCETGDAITLKVNGEIALPIEILIYPPLHQLIEACFNVTGEIPKWLVVLNPAGGETFYQDSTVTIKWTSTGITGPVEISLIGNDRPSPLIDTTDNDGHHNVSIPVGVTEDSDWKFAIRDLDEGVLGVSNAFTVSSVELLVEPNGLQFHGVLNDCVLDQKQFTISEKSGFNIPFEIIDTISWLSVSPMSGATPAVITVSILANDLAIGNYLSILPISSDNAVNSPSYKIVELDNGQYVCGDFNNDCQLRVGDLSYMLDYLYRGGTAPLYPDALNVDRCDGIDIADIDYLYTLATDLNPPICEGVEKCESPANDLGERDSLGFVVSQAPSVSEITPRLQLDLYLFNDGNIVNGLASGFSWDNANMVLDSVRISPYVADSLSLNFVFEDDVIDSSNINRRFLFAANKTIFTGIQPSPTPQLLASYYFTLSSWTNVDSVVVDSLTFGQGTTYKAVTNNGSYQPVWRGPVINKEQGF